MLAMIERIVPVSATLAGAAALRTAWPSSILISTPSGCAIERLPLGPFTVTLPDWMSIWTPLTMTIGLLAIRDMLVTPLCHEAQDFTADALLARLRIGHDALRGGNDGNAEAVEDLGQLVLAAVLTQTRPGEALQLLDNRLAFVVLQLDLEFVLAIADVGNGRAQDVAFVLQDLGDGHLDLGRGHFHRRLADRGRIADADEHVGDGISHAHV